MTQNTSRKSDTSPSLYAHWKKNFTVTYEIRFSKNINESHKLSQYTIFKADLIKRFNALHSEYPNSDILIRFDDKYFCIQIGYVYQDFYGLIGPHTYRGFLPTEEDYLFQNNSLIYKNNSKDFEVFSKVDHQTLKSLKDGSHFALNYGHKFFWNEVSDSLKKSAASFKYTLPSQSGKNSFFSDIAKISHNNNKHFRWVIGEAHHYPDAKNMIRDAIKSGIFSAGTTIAVEGLFYERHQIILDKWRKSPQGTPPPLELKSDLEYDTALEELLLAAKAKNLRILAIETEAIATLSNVERIKGMNYIAKEIINHEVGQGSFVALVGAMHAANTTITTHDGKVEKVPPLGRLLDNVGTALVLDTTLPSPLSFNQTLVTYDVIRACEISLEADIIVKAEAIPEHSPMETKQDREIRLAQKKAAKQQQTKSESQNHSLNNDTIDISNTKQHLPHNEQSHPDEITTSTFEITKQQKESGNKDHSLNNETTDVSRNNSNPPQEDRSDLDQIINSTVETTVESAQSKESPKQKQTLSYKNAVISGGMLVLGGAGAINSFKKEDVFNGITGIAETISGAAGLLANFLIYKSQEVLKLLSHSPILLKTAAQITKGAGHFLKIVPFAGAAFSAIAAGQDIKNIIDASKLGDIRGIIKAAVDLVLDVAMGIADLLPGVGTLASFSLLAGRMTAGLLIDQACDPEAYKKTWALIDDPNNTWFDKAIASVSGTLQLIWKYTPLGQISTSIFNTIQTTEQLKKIETAFKEAKSIVSHEIGSILTATDVPEEEARFIDCSALSLYTNVGFFTLKIGQGGQKATAQAEFGILKPPQEITLGTTNVDKVYVKMGYSSSFSYTVEKQTVEAGPGDRGVTFDIPTSIQALIGSQTSYYYAPDDETNIVFIAPPNPKKGLLPVFKANDFDYKIYGGKGTNIYKLGNQNATIHCGTGINKIELPFNAETEQRTLVLKKFRHDDKSCFLTLKGLRTHSDFFQNAKIGVDKNSSPFLKFGATKIEFDSNTNKTLLMSTDDGAFEVNIDRLLKEYSAETETDFKNYIRSSLIEKKEENIIDENVVSLKSNDKSKLTFNERKDNGMYSLSLRHIKNDSDLFKQAKISFSAKSKHLILTFGNKIIKFQNENVKYLSLLTDDHLSFVNIEEVRKSQGSYRKFALKRGKPYEIIPPVVHGDENVWETFDLQKYIVSSITRLDTLFSGTPGKDAFIFDAQKIGKVTLKNFSITDGDILQIINASNENDSVQKAVQHNEDVVITFDDCNELTLTQVKLSDLNHFIRKPALYGLSGKKDEFMIDAKTIGRVAIKNFSVADGDMLRIANTSETKENLRKKAQQRDKDVIIPFDALNELILENIQISEISNDYLLLDVAA